MVLPVMADAVWSPAQIGHGTEPAAGTEVTWAVPITPPMARAVTAIGVAHVRGILVMVISCRQWCVRAIGLLMPMGLPGRP
jgi:hypothetical protein